MERWTTGRSGDLVLTTVNPAAVNSRKVPVSSRKVPVSSLLAPGLRSVVSTDWRPHRAGSGPGSLAAREGQVAGPAAGGRPQRIPPTAAGIR